MVLYPRNLHIVLNLEELEPNISPFDIRVQDTVHLWYVSEWWKEMLSLYCNFKFSIFLSKQVYGSIFY
jgi:hypothetical protein